MTADISMYTPRVMIAALEQIEKPSTWLLDTFFPTSIMHETDKIDIDIIDKGGKRMAPFVSPRIAGKVVKKRGFRTNTYTAPYIKESTITHAFEIMNRRPGETIYANPGSPAQRAAQELGKDMADLRDRILRRMEWMAASCLTTGTLTISGDGIEDSIDFGMKSTHKPDLSGAALWSAATGKPFADLCTWADLIAEDSGIYPDICVMGKNVAAAFRANANVLADLDKLNVKIGTLNPMPRVNEVKWIMHHDESGLDIVQYSGAYYDEATSANKPFIPDDMLIIGSRNAYTRRHYGVIKDLEAGNAMVEFFPKTWIEKEPSAQMLLVQSAPLVAIHQVDAFLVATPL